MNKSWFLLVFLAIIWGSSFILIKKGLIAFNGVQVGALRMTISSVVFLPFLLSKVQKVRKKDFKYFAIVSLLGSGFPAILFAIAEMSISSSVAGILNSLTPLFTLVLGVLFFGQVASRLSIWGVICGLIGAVLLILFLGASDTTGKPLYALLVVLATICYAISGNTVNRYLPHYNSFTISVVAFSILVIPGLILLSFTDFREAMATHPQAWFSLSAVLVLSLIGTTFAIVLFFYLLQMTNPVFASSVAYLIPVVALIFAFWDGEPIGVAHLLAMVLIIIGVYLSRR